MTLTVSEETGVVLDKEAFAAWLHKKMDEGVESVGNPSNRMDCPLHRYVAEEAGEEVLFYFCGHNLSHISFSFPNPPWAHDIQVQMFNDCTTQNHDISPGRVLELLDGAAPRGDASHRSSEGLLITR